MISCVDEKRPVLIESLPIVEKLRYAKKTSAIAIKIIRQTIRVVHASLCALPKIVHRTARATRVFSVLDLVVELPTLANELYALGFASTASDFLSSSFRSLFSVSTVIRNSVNITEGLQAFGLFKRPSENWTESLLMYLYPISVVRTAMDIQEFCKRSKDLSLKRQRLTISLPEAQSVVSELQSLTFQRLELGSTSYLDRKMHAIQAAVISSQPEVIAEGNRAVARLIRRIDSCLRIEQLILFARVTQCVTMGVSLGIGQYPALRVLTAAASVVSLAMVSARFILITSDLTN